MADQDNEQWIEASPPLDFVLMVYVALAVPFSLIGIFSIGVIDPDYEPSLGTKVIGVCALLGIIPVARRKRRTTLRWNDKRIQQIGFMQVISTYNWDELTDVKEAGSLQRATTFVFGYGKSLRLITGPGYLPMSDYYKVLNLAKRKLKENARTS